MVGSNVDEEHFRVLKIDRSEPRELVLHDDGTVYTKAEFLDLLKMIEVGNRTKVGQRMGSGLNKTMSSYGIIGFVRFLEGYYIYLITKRLKVAMVGHHSIYKIEYLNKSRCLLSCYWAAIWMEIQHITNSR